MDVITAWLVALGTASVVGGAGTIWAFVRSSRGLGWTMLGLTLAAVGALLILGWYWAITEGHLTG